MNLQMTMRERRSTKKIRCLQLNDEARSTQLRANEKRSPIKREGWRGARSSRRLISAEITCGYRGG
jgi:hypothetical protein